MIPFTSEIVYLLSQTYIQKRTFPASRTRAQHREEAPRRTDSAFGPAGRAGIGMQRSLRKPLKDSEGNYGSRRAL